ncbi:MAG TPA: branched-chain amino acid ABC transporter permease [Xanthobacteraceae bacterium]|nr:branched-chain amino acid ABC transporter permease [Xanthobacteraceae bacterium]
MMRVPPWLEDWRRLAGITAGAAVLLALPPFMAGGFTLHLFTTGLYYTILAASWNLLAGFTGQFSLAHHAFAAIGAYTSGLLIRYYGLPIWFTIASGVFVAAALGFGLGRMVLSMRAIYLAIATWAFAETVHILLTAAYPITRGELGLNVPPLFNNLDPVAYYVLFAALTLASLVTMHLIVRSPLGYFMRAIRDDDLRAESLGVDTTRVKVIVFTVSSAFAGLAGACYGHYLVVLSPQMADFNEMAKLIIMVVLGGLGTVLGPIIGAAPVQILTTYLQKYGEWDLVIFAVVVIALMRTHVGGIAAFIHAGMARLKRRVEKKPALT